MNVERAAEIIAAYGGDAARWPDAERAAALQVIAANAGLEQARRDALMLDTALSGWSRQWDETRPAAGDAGAAAARVLAAARSTTRPARPLWRWAIGTGMAAAVAAGVMLANPLAAPLHAPAAHNAAADAAAFAMVFTPTPDEDGSI